MSDEYRPEDEVEGHGPLIPDNPFTEGPESEAGDEPDFEAHGPLIPDSPLTEGPRQQTPVTE